MTLLLKLVMLVTMTDTTVAHKSMKAPPTKRGSADAELAMNNETLHWHEVCVCVLTSGYEGSVPIL